MTNTETQILAARQALESSQQEAGRPLVQFTPGMARTIQAPVDRLTSFGQLQVAEGQRKKAVKDIQRQTREFESEVARVTPEYGKEEFVQQAYEVAKKKVEDKISGFTREIEVAQSEIKSLTQSGLPSSQIREQIKKINNRIDKYRAERDAWKEQTTKSKKELIKAVSSGKISALARAYKAEVRADIQSRKEIEKQKEKVKEILTRSPGAVVYYDAQNVPYVLRDEKQQIITQEAIEPIAYFKDKEKLTVKDVDYIFQEVLPEYKELTEAGKDVPQWMKETLGEWTTPSLEDIGVDKEAIEPVFFTSTPKEIGRSYILIGESKEDIISNFEKLTKDAEKIGIKTDVPQPKDIPQISLIGITKDSGVQSEAKRKQIEQEKEKLNEKITSQLKEAGIIDESKKTSSFEETSKLVNKDPTAYASFILNLRSEGHDVSFSSEKTEFGAYKIDGIVINPAGIRGIEVTGVRRLEPFWAGTGKPEETGWIQKFEDLVSREKKTKKEEAEMLGISLAPKEIIPGVIDPFKSSPGSVIKYWESKEIKPESTFKYTGQQTYIQSPYGSPSMPAGGIEPSPFFRDVYAGVTQITPWFKEAPKEEIYRLVEKPYSRKAQSDFYKATRDLEKYRDKIPELRKDYDSLINDYMGAKITEREYQKKLNEIQSDPAWKYAITPTSSIFKEFTTGEDVPKIVKVGTGALMGGTSMAPYLIAAPVMGFLHFGKGFEELSEGRVKEGAIDIGLGAFLFGHGAPIAKGTVKTVKTVQPVTSLGKAKAVAVQASFPVGLGSYRAVTEFKSTGDIWGSIGVGIGTAGAIGLKQLAAREARMVTVQRKIDPEAITKTAKKITVEGRLDKVNLYRINIGKEEITLPLDSRAYQEIVKQGRITLVYTKGQLDYKAILDRITDKQTSGLFIVGKYQAPGSRYFPMPKYIGTPYGGEIKYGFDAKKTAVISKAEALKQREYVINQMVKQGWTKSAAEKELRYLKPEDFLYYYTRTKEASPFLKSEKRFFNIPVKGKKGPEDLLIEGYPGIQVTGGKREFSEMALREYRLPIQTKTSYELFGKKFYGKTKGEDLTQWLKEPALKPFQPIAKLDNLFLTRGFEAFVIGKATPTADVRVLQSLQKVENFERFIRDPRLWKLENQAIVERFGFSSPSDVAKLKGMPKIITSDEQAIKALSRLAGSKTSFKIDTSGKWVSSIKDLRATYKIPAKVSDKYINLIRKMAQDNYLRELSGQAKEGFSVPIWNQIITRTPLTGKSKGVPKTFIGTSVLPVKRVTTQVFEPDGTIGIKTVTLKKEGTDAFPKMKIEETTFPPGKKVDFETPGKYVQTKEVRQISFLREVKSIKEMEAELLKKELASPKGTLIDINPLKSKLKISTIDTMQTTKAPAYKTLEVSYMQYSKDGVVDPTKLIKITKIYRSSEGADLTYGHGVVGKGDLTTVSEKVVSSKEPLRYLHKQMVSYEPQVSIKQLTSSDLKNLKPGFFKDVRIVEIIKPYGKTSKITIPKEIEKLYSMPARAVYNDYLGNLVFKGEKISKEIAARPMKPFSPYKITKGEFKGWTMSGDKIADISPRGAPPPEYFIEDSSRINILPSKEYFGLSPKEIMDKVTSPTVVPGKVGELKLTPAKMDYSVVVKDDDFLTLMAKKELYLGKPTTIITSTPTPIPIIPKAFSSPIIATQEIIGPFAITPGVVPAIYPTTTMTPISKPITSPVTTPVITSITTPIASPITTPIVTTTPIATPTTTPIISPTIITTPIVTPVTVPVVTPIVVPVITPTITPTYTPMPTTQVFSKPTYIPPWWEEEKDKKEKKDEEEEEEEEPGFIVELRRKKKFKVISPFPLPKKEAMKLGIKRTLGTAAATFRIKPSKKPAKSLGLSEPTAKELKIFRAPRTKVPQPLTFIQKERKRILTPGEKREITFVGIEAASRAARIKTRKVKRSNDLFTINRKGGKQRWF